MNKEEKRANQKAAFDKMLNAIKEEYKKSGKTWGDPIYNVAGWNDAKDFRDFPFDRSVEKSGTIDEVIDYLTKQHFEYSEALTMVAIAAANRLPRFSAFFMAYGSLEEAAIIMLQYGFAASERRAIYSVAIDVEKAQDIDWDSDADTYEAGEFDLFRKA